MSNLEPPPAPVPPAASLADATTAPPPPTLPPVPTNSAPTTSLILENDKLISITPLQVARLTSRAKLPTRGSALSAGYDLYAAEGVKMPPGGRALVPTDIAIATPPGTYGRVAPRSGLSVKKGLSVGAGVIDHDYRGAVGVLLFNFGDAEITIEAGERCAQLVLERYVGADVVDMTVEGAGRSEEVDMARAKGLLETARGSGGFGSTGTN